MSELKSKPMPRWELTPDSLLERAPAGGIVLYSDARAAIEAAVREKDAEMEALRENLEDKKLLVVMRAEQAERERDELRQQLGDVLAVLHGDGGHHTEAVGIKQSVEDAIEKRNKFFIELDELRARLETIYDAPSVRKFYDGELCRYVDLIERPRRP